MLEPERDPEPPGDAEPAPAFLDAVAVALDHAVGPQPRGERGQIGRASPPGRSSRSATARLPGSRRSSRAVYSSSRAALPVAVRSASSRAAPSSQLTSATDGAADRDRAGKPGRSIGEARVVDPEVERQRPAGAFRPQPDRAVGADASARRGRGPRSPRPPRAPRAAAERAPAQVRRARRLHGRVMHRAVEERARGSARRGTATRGRRGSRRQRGARRRASTPAGLNVSPTPTVPPSSFSSSRVTIARPSERSASCHSPCPPSRTTAMSTRRVLALGPLARQARREPGRAASESRHTSPPTMQRPVRTVVMTRSPTPGDGDGATAARSDADDEEDRDVLGGRLALVVHSGS